MLCRVVCMKGFGPTICDAAFSGAVPGSSDMRVHFPLFSHSIAESAKARSRAGFNGQASIQEMILDAQFYSEKWHR